MARMRKLTMVKRFAPKAKQLAEENAGKIAENVNKATDFVDEKTKGRYTDKLQKVDAKADEFARQQGQAPAAGTTDGAPADSGAGADDHDAADATAGGDDADARTDTDARTGTDDTDDDEPST